MTYWGWYLQRSSAERMVRICQRRGWEPALSRKLGVWFVHVEMSPLGDAVTLPGPVTDAATAPAGVPAPSKPFAASTREP